MLVGSLLMQMGKGGEHIEQAMREEERVVTFIKFHFMYQFEYPFPT